MIKNKKIIKKNGFSLAELSISVTIISILLGASFSMVFGNTNVAKYKDTETRMKIIEAAISSFVAKYNRLPCGGDITLKASATNAGIETYNCVGQTYYKVQTAPTIPITYSDSVGYDTTMVIGSVPYRILGLPQEYIADAWGNKFIYAQTRALGKNGLETTNMGTVIIRDGVGAVITNNAAYALISTGANGNGGFPINGTSAKRKAAPTDASELSNYNAVQIPASNLGFFVAKEPTSTYDDIVHFKQKWQVVKEAGAVLSNETCARAKSLIEDKEVIKNTINYSSLCLDVPRDRYCATYAYNFLYKMRELCLN